jgi:hypothetical protein
VCFFYVHLLLDLLVNPRDVSDIFHLTSVDFQRTTRRYIPGARTLENFKFILQSVNILGTQLLNKEET